MVSQTTDSILEGKREHPLVVYGAREPADICF